MSGWEQRWRSENVKWGITECGVRGCSRAAELLVDEHLRCIECADDELERLIAVSIAPRLRELLPNIEDR